MGFCYGPSNVSYTGSALLMLGTGSAGGGPAAVGDVLNVHYDSWTITRTAPGSGTGYVYFYDWTNPAASRADFLQTGPHTHSYTCPDAGLYTVSFFVLPATGLDIDLVNLSLDAPFCAGGGSIFCQYGTRLASTGSLLFYLTPGAIDAALTDAGLLWLAPLFTAFWFTFINAQELCGTGPPPMPTFDAQDFINIALGAPGPSQLKVHQALESLFWPLVCECVPAPPGSPPPVPPPPPTTTPPPGLPVTVIVEPAPCDGTDVCTVLNQIIRAIGSLQRSILRIENTTTLVQRQKTPFAYVTGNLHSGLTGSGQFAVQGILGVAVQLTTLPNRIGEEAGDPLAYFDVGWVTTGTLQGWRKSLPIRHNPQWLDAEPDDTLVGYSFTPGVVANILELIREP